MTKVNLKTLGRSSVAAWLAEVWRIASRFVITPIVIAQIGLEGYGTWTLMFSVCAYISMFNISFGIAYSKYTAELVRKDELPLLGEILGAGMLTIGSVAGLALAAAFAFRTPLLVALNVPPELLGDAEIVLTIVMALLVLRMTYGCSFEVLSGLQRIDISYKLNILASVIDFAVTVPLLFAGFDLLALAIGYATGQVVSTTLAFVAVNKECPGIVISPFRATRDGFRKVFGLGGRFQLLSLLVIATDEGVKLLLSALLGVHWLGIYELADKLLRLGQSITHAVLAPLMPAFADLHAAGDREGVKRLVLKGSKVVSVSAVVPFAFLALFAHQVLIVWTGESVPDAARTIQWLVLAELITLLTGIGTSSLRAQGRVGLEFGYALIGALLLIGGLAPLYAVWGYYGVVLARAVAAAVSAIWFLQAYARREKIGLIEYLRGATLVPIVACASVAIGVVALGHSVLPTFAGFGWAPRWAALAEVALWAAPYLAIGAVLIWRLALNDSERSMTAAFVRGKLGQSPS